MKPNDYDDPLCKIFYFVVGKMVTGQVVTSGTHPITSIHYFCVCILYKTQHIMFYGLAVFAVASN
jgi:hypothetical protein